VEKHKERELGSALLPVSFVEMKEATVRDEPNVPLIGPNGGEVIGYLHLKMQYFTHSDLGRNDAAACIQFHERCRAQRQRAMKVREKTEEKRARKARDRRKKEEKKVLYFTRLIQRQWRLNRRAKEQILRQFSAFVEHDKALLRKPLRICFKSPETGDVHTPWGARLLLYGDLDAVDSLQLLWRPPKDAVYRSYAAVRKAIRDVSALVRAVPEVLDRRLPKIQTTNTNLLLERQRAALAEQRATGQEMTQRDQMPYSTAYEALCSGEALSLNKIVRVDVYNYTDVRLKILLASNWLQPSAAPLACELVLQAHSSAAMLVWLEVLKVGIRGKWAMESSGAEPTGRHTVRPLPLQTRRKRPASNGLRGVRGATSRKSSDDSWDAGSAHSDSADEIVTAATDSAEAARRWQVGSIILRTRASLRSSLGRRRRIGAAPAADAAAAQDAGANQRSPVIRVLPPSPMP